MAYFPYGGYQPGYYGQPVPDQLMQLRQNQQMQNMQQMPMQPTMQMPAQQPASNGIIWVQGEEGAKAYLTSPNTSVMLMDSEKNTFYIKASDQSGMPLPLRVFDYVERTIEGNAPTQAMQQPNIESVTREEFDALAAKVNSIMMQETPKAKRTVAKEGVENG